MIKAIFPQPIKTDRLLVCAAEPQDAQMLYQIVNQSIEMLKPWMHWVKDGVTIKALTAFCGHAYAKYWLNEECHDFCLIKNEW